MAKKLDKSNQLSEASRADLTAFVEELKFVDEFGIELYKAIGIILQILNLDWEQIEEWREHVETNHSRSGLDDFTIRVIDRYCSDIEEEA